MRVTFHGVRGSVPTPGPSTVRYGGNTSCLEVRLRDGSVLIIDAGTGLRGLGKSLASAPLPDPIHLLVTHVHWDHIMGAPFFAPLWRTDARIVCHAFSQRGRDRFSRKVLFDGEHFPVRAADIPARLEMPPITVGAAQIGSASVTRVALNHPGGSNGFRVQDDDGATLLYLTDNELDPPGPATIAPAELARFAADASLMVHDAQYLPADMPHKKGWGHSLVDDVLELGRAAGARSLALFHHDPERDDAALDRVGAHAREWTAARAPAMAAFVAAEGATVELLPR